MNEKIKLVSSMFGFYPVRKYKLHTPDNTYIIRTFGLHLAYISIENDEHCYEYVTLDKYIVVTLKTAFQLVGRYYPLPYYKPEKCILEEVKNNEK